MKAMKRIQLLCRENGIVLSNYSSIDSVPISFKLEIIKDLIKHIDDNGTGFPTYGSLNLRNKVTNLIYSYGAAISNSPGAWLNFIKLSERLGTLILREYAESKESRT